MRGRMARALACSLSLSALLLLAAARPASAVVINETNDTFDTAQPLDGFFSDQSSNPNIFPNAENDPTLPIFPSVTINGAIDVNNDVDFYSFTGFQGARTFFDIDGTGNTTGGPTDVFLSLFDPNGTLLAFSDSSPFDPGNNEGSSDAFIGVFTLPETGLYRIAVSNAFNFPTGLGRGGPALALVAAPEPVILTRPDGQTGGETTPQAGMGNSSFTNGGSDLTTGLYVLNVSVETIPAPEPGTMTLMAIGLASLGAARRKQKQGRDDAQDDIA